MPETILVNNWLFSGMSAPDQDVLRPALARREVAHSEVLFHAGDVVDVIHFPVSAQIANIMRFDTGESLAVSSVGREGVTGLAAFMAVEPLGWDAIVQVPGVVWTVPAHTVRALAASSPEFATQLLKATHANQVEAHNLAICATFHAALPRVARWLLTLQERTGQASFTFTQEDLAGLLGVRRSTVNEAMIALRTAGAVRGKLRGRVTIADRAVLKVMACSCNRAH